MINTIKNTNFEIAINGSCCFDELTEAEYSLVKKNSVEISFKKGEIISKQGAFATHLMFLKTGLVKLFIEGSTNLILNIFPKEKLIGVSSLFGGAIFKYSVSALEDSVLYFIDVNTVKQILTENINFSNSLLKRSNKISLYTYVRIYNLTQKQLTGKLASILIYLSKEVFHNKKINSLTRKDLAEFAGMSVMSAIRVLNSFKKEKIIKENNGTIEIIDFELLERYYQIG